MDIAAKEIYNELSEIINDGIAEFTNKSEETFSELINLLNSEDNVTVIPPYARLVEKSCNEAYLHTLATFSEILLNVCDNLAEQISFNYSSFTDKFIELEKQISELQAKLNSN